MVSGVRFREAAGADPDIEEGGGGGHTQSGIGVTMWRAQPAQFVARAS